MDIYDEGIQLDGWSGEEGFPEEVMLEQIPAEGVKREGEGVP